MVEPTQFRSKIAVRVWDPAVRGIHWSQMVLVAVALATGFLAPKTWLGVHVVVGYGLTGLLLCRLVWGVFGPGYARFASFLFHPRRVWDHLKSVIQRRPDAHLGHNPAGAVMVTALLGCLAVIVATGFLVLGGTYKEGPLGPWADYAAGQGAHQIHRMLAWLLLAMIGIHLVGVWIESRLSGDNLVRAMIDGHKLAAADHPLPPPRPARPWVAFGTLVVLGLFASVATVWATRQPIPGVPDLAPDPVYRNECGACHWAYHPSLLPAAAWQRMMTGLDDHFGEDASLSPAHAALILRWLSDHAAETWDTLPAHGLRIVDPAQPFRITATPFWQSQHRSLAPALFKHVKGGAGNCAACHNDADRGRFSFRNIHLPAETVR